jgi:hypothetical protein
VPNFRINFGDSHVLEPGDLWSKPLGGRYGDANRLYLQVSSNSAKSWIFRWKIEGKTRYSGLGPYPAITLKAP